MKLCEKSEVNVMILHNKYLLERCGRFYTPSARKPWLTVNRVQARCSRDPLLLRQFGGDMESEKMGEILDVLQFSALDFPKGLLHKTEQICEDSEFQSESFQNIIQKVWGSRWVVIRNFSFLFMEIMIFNI